MSKRSESVKKWRQNTKKRMVDAFGGVCCVCKNEYKPELFDFHHLDPKEKDFGFGASRASCKAWAKLVIELRKCVMMCSNCHRLIHYGYVDLPDDVKIFDESYTEYKIVGEITYCPVCGKPKSKQNVTCSVRCGAKLRRRVDWDSVDLIELKKTLNNGQIGDILNISEAAVRKRYIKITNDLR